jgi:2-polyprenyl-3-methyl-5-hydroxy-6-metoxy-1,4-benzoquinol methylase
MNRFAHRSTEIEIMDDLDCHGPVVDQTLRELEFINRWLGGNDVTLQGVRHLAEGATGSISIADLGCGGGDMLKLIADIGRRKGIPMQLTGIDANPNIIAFARNNCSDYPEIKFETVDIFSAEFQSRSYDIVTGTLFYHHFTSEQLTAFFSQLRRQVRIGFVFNDIHRHWLAYHSIHLLTRIFSKSSMVQYDAPLSVLRAFRKAELQAIFRHADVPVTLRWKWAFRWQGVYRALP